MSALAYTAIPSAPAPLPPSASRKPRLLAALIAVCALLLSGAVTYHYTTSSSIFPSGTTPIRYDTVFSSDSPAIRFFSPTSEGSATALDNSPLSGTHFVRMPVSAGDLEAASHSSLGSGAQASVHAVADMPPSSVQMGHMIHLTQQAADSVFRASAWNRAPLYNQRKAAGALDGQAVEHPAVFVQDATKL